MTAIMMWIACGPVFAQYQGPLPGEVDTGNVKLAYQSDSKGGQVVNVVKNRNQGSSSAATWRGGYIERSRNPLKPGESHRISFWCPRVSVNGNAILYYGSAGSSQPAAAYDCSGERVAGLPPVVKSEVAFGTGEEAFSLEVISTHVDDEVVYSFIQNRRLQVSLRLPPQVTDALATRGWKPEAMRDIEGVERLKTQEWDAKGFSDFVTITSPDERSAVRIRTERVEIVPQLFLISDRGQLLGTGVMSLHVPRTER